MGASIEAVEGPIWLGDSKIKGFGIFAVSVSFHRKRNEKRRLYGSLNNKTTSSPVNRCHSSFVSKEEKRAACTYPRTLVDTNVRTHETVNIQFLHFAESIVRLDLFVLLDQVQRTSLLEWCVGEKKFRLVVVSPSFVREPACRFRPILSRFQQEYLL